MMSESTDLKKITYKYGHVSVCWTFQDIILIEMEKNGIISETLNTQKMTPIIEFVVLKCDTGPGVAPEYCSDFKRR